MTTKTGAVRLLRMLVATHDDVVMLVLRLTLGGVMLPHGAGKMFTWFGRGFSATMAGFTGKLHIPWTFAFLAIIAEFFGALGLVVGLCGRVAAFGIGCVMAVALSMSYRNGLFMNWDGMKKGEGIEFHLLALGIVVALMIRGSGKWSIDRAIITRWR